MCGLVRYFNIYYFLSVAFHSDYFALVTVVDDSQTSSLVPQIILSLEKSEISVARMPAPIGEITEEYNELHVSYYISVLL